MLTRLHFKNWRSLKDVEINDLTPITVFIGANSSGKTNLVDALKFWRHLMKEWSVKNAYAEWENRAIRTVGVDPAEPITLEFQLPFREIKDDLIYQIRLEHTDEFHYYERIMGHGRGWRNPQNIEGKDGVMYIDNKPIKRLIDARLLFKTFTGFPYIYYWLGEWGFLETNRWQILDQGFKPQATSSYRLGSDVIASDASNVPASLDFLAAYYPKLYAEFQNDVMWLLRHLQKIETKRIKDEIQICLYEKSSPDVEVPLISLGTLRIITMLLLFYAVNTNANQWSGLVVIEEPDVGLHPLILKRFVELLRNFSEHPDRPRQIFLTTHNPTFLNYFQPEEVRIVERDQRGYTQIRKIPDHIKDIWLHEYKLGEIWMKRALGGVPE